MADENDDLLNPDEIEALLRAHDPASSPAGPESSEPSGDTSPSPAAPHQPTDNSGDLLDADDIEALLRESATDRAPAASDPPLTATGLSGTEQLLQQAEADLAAAVAPELNVPRSIPPQLEAAQAFDFPDLGQPSSAETVSASLESLHDVELDLCIELGRTELLIEEVLRLKEGAVVPLDKLAGDPVDILVNGRLVARGEVLVLNDNFCVRVAEILAPDH